jgi:carboxypeptidase Taq
MPPQAYEELKTRLAEIQDLERAQSLLNWDERTFMPAGGAAARAEQVATLERLRHELLALDEVARLLDALRSWEEGLSADSDEATLVRLARRDHEKARRVPPELKADMARAASQGQRAWRAARADADFASFLPYLERNLELKLRYAGHFDVDHPYDALLDDFEPGVATAEVERILDELKVPLLPLIDRIAERSGAVDDSCLHGHFPVERQRELSLELAEGLPLPDGAWRLDETAHPFASAPAIGDVRITTRYDESYIGTSIFATLHEFGHAVYDNGVDRAFERTPLAQTVSHSLHESQSRLWENMVGRCLAFWRRFYPRLQTAFPDQLGGVELERFHRAINRVQPSLIRIEADELTYNLHVVLRFELELELVERRLLPRDLPEAWNARVERYLGLEVPDDAHGVLQDVHWSEGSFGYFPTYAIGNVIAGQVWSALRGELPDLEEQLARGELEQLRDWLRERIYRHGRRWGMAETVERATGAPIDVAPYVAYLEEKTGAIYSAV